MAATIKEMERRASFPEILLVEVFIDRIIFFVKHMK